MKILHIMVGSVMIKQSITTLFLWIALSFVGGIRKITFLF